MDLVSPSGCLLEDIHLAGLYMVKESSRDPKILQEIHNDWSSRDFYSVAICKLAKDHEEVFQMASSNLGFQFTFSLDLDFIDWETMNIPVEAHLFWRHANSFSKLLDMIEPWMNNKQMNDHSELAFIDKLIEMRKIQEKLKAYENITPCRIERSESFLTFFKRMPLDRQKQQLLEEFKEDFTFHSPWIEEMFKRRLEESGVFEQVPGRLMRKKENLLFLYNALKCGCDFDYDVLINIIMFQNILTDALKNFNQEKMIMILRAGMNLANTIILENYLEQRNKIPEFRKLIKFKTTSIEPATEKCFCSNKKHFVTVKEEIMSEEIPDINTRLTAPTQNVNPGTSSDNALDYSPNVYATTMNDYSTKSGASSLFTTGKSVSKSAKSVEETSYSLQEQTHTKSTEKESNSDSDPECLEFLRNDTTFLSSNLHSQNF